MEAIGIIGVLVSIILLMTLVFRGYHVLPVTILVSVIVFLTNNVSVWSSLQEGYATSLVQFIGNYLIMFLMGSILGEVLSKSGAGRSIAIKLADVFGADKAMLITILSATILSYGGVSVFVIIFSIYPIALYLFKEADIPKRLIPGTIMLGAGSYTMTTLPGTPALTNIVPTTYLGTPSTAAPTIGIIAGIVMFISGYAILTAYEKKVKRNGEKFVPGPNDIVPELTEEETQALPSFGKSILPLITIIGIILGERILSTDLEAVLIVVIGLTAGTIVTYGLFWNRIEDKKETIAKGSEGSISALMNTSAVVGFGGSIQMVPAFKSFVNFALNLSFPPLLSAALAVNIIAAVSASSSAGITIFMESMAGDFITAGVNPEVLHRIASMGAGVLDSLPHAGPNVTFLMVTGLTYKEGYPGIFISTLIVPLIGLITALSLAFMGIV